MGIPYRAVAVALAAVLLLSGCMTMERTTVVKEPSYVVDPASTPLGRSLLPAERSHPGLSGFDLLSYGLESLVARAAIVDGSVRSVDAQYYIYATDEAGSIFMLHLIAAAKRGVRVRLLLDDFNLGDDRDLAVLSSVPNFQIRVFNPVPFRARWARIPEYALTFGRSDRRMHNKLLIGDNALAILGGRNIENDYFNLDSRATFRDFDLLAAGPAVRAASADFDRYWNSPWAVPAGALARGRPDPNELDTLVHRLERRATRAASFEAQYQATQPKYLSTVVEGGGLVWAPGEIIADSPARVSGADASDDDSVAARLGREWDQAQHEVLIECAYFLPGTQGVDLFRAMTDRGVKVRLVTSALATSDVPMVYLAYEKYRLGLLQAGVDLHEYRVVPAVKTSPRPWYRSGHSYSILHSKVIVFDRRKVWIGSLNLDPRSIRLDTEIAAVVDSEVLAKRLADDIGADMAPDRSWKLTLEPSSGTSRLRIVWKAEQDGHPITRAHDPASWLRRFDELLLHIIPGIENQL